MGDSPPKFTTKPSLKQEGSGIVFSCELEASPKPDVVWYRGDALLQDDPRIEAKTETLADNKYRLGLIVKNVTPDDSGTYKVEAKNKFGQMAANMNLNLQGKYVSCALISTC